MNKQNCVFCQVVFSGICNVQLCAVIQEDSFPAALQLSAKLLSSSHFSTFNFVSEFSSVMPFAFSFLSHCLSENSDLYVTMALFPARHCVPLNAAALCADQECAARGTQQVQRPMFSLCEGFGRYYRIIGLTAFTRVMYMTGILTQRSPDIWKASLYAQAFSNTNVAHLDLISYITPASESRRKKKNQTTVSLQRKQTSSLPRNGKYRGFLGRASTKIIQENMVILKGY